MQLPACTVTAASTNCLPTLVSPSQQNRACARAISRPSSIVVVAAMSMRHRHQSR